MPADGTNEQRGNRKLGDITVTEATPEFRSALVDCIPHLRAYARSLARNRDRADDLVHDTAVRALAAAHQVTPGSNFKAWIFVILRNLYYNQGRKGFSHNVPFDATTDAKHAIAPTQERTLEFCDFRRAFGCLGDEQREVLMLIGASGISYEEAAKICNCAVGTIKSRVSRAREELTRLLSEDTLSRRAEFAPIAQASPIEALQKVRPASSRRNAGTPLRIRRNAA